MIAIIDYGAGNLRSVARAVSRLGYSFQVTSSPTEVLKADAVILPGVGAAADTMRSLADLGLIDPVRRVVTEDRPFFGICLGLQVLLTVTEEGGRHDCFDLFPGEVKKLPLGLKVPHMGWNQVWQKKEHAVFAGIPDGANFYFVHSYYADPDDPELVAGATEYGVTFCSAIARGNLFATQFHPEKSGSLGLQILDNFCKQVDKG